MSNEFIRRMVRYFGIPFERADVYSEEAMCLHTVRERFKLRLCENVTQAETVSEIIRTFPDVFPRMIKCVDRFILMEWLPSRNLQAAYEDHFLGETQLEWMGELYGRVAGRSVPGSCDELASEMVGVIDGLTSCPFRRDLTGVYFEKLVASGCPIVLEMHDPYLKNFVEGRKGHLRFVDERGIMSRPKWSGLVSGIFHSFHVGDSVVSSRRSRLFLKGCRRECSVVSQDDPVLDFVLLHCLVLLSRFFLVKRIEHPFKLLEAFLSGKRRRVDDALAILSSPEPEDIDPWQSK